MLIFLQNLILACISSCNSLFNTKNVIVKGVKGSKDANRGASWSYGETITLINIWWDANVQDEFEKSRRNANMYEKIAKKWTGCWINSALPCSGAKKSGTVAPLSKQGL